MKTVVNLTPHPITILGEDNEEVTFAPSGEIARVVTVEEEPFFIEGLEIPIKPDTRYLGIGGLPEPQEGIIFLVSAIVRSQAFGRKDVFSPGTGPKDDPVRDEEGRIKAVRCFVAAPS